MDITSGESIQLDLIAELKEHWLRANKTNGGKITIYDVMNETRAFLGWKTLNNAGFGVDNIIGKSIDTSGLTFEDLLIAVQAGCRRYFPVEFSDPKQVAQIKVYYYTLLNDYYEIDRDVINRHYQKVYQDENILVVKE